MVTEISNVGAGRSVGPGPGLGRWVGAGPGGRRKRFKNNVIKLVST